MKNTENDLYLLFKVDGQMYGIPSNNITGIQNIEEITAMSGSSYFVKGVINYAGTITPIIDLYLRFGKPERGYTEYACIILVDVDGSQKGFIADEVSELVSICKSQIIQPPTSVSESTLRFVDAVGNIDNNLILLLNSSALFSEGV
jgi:purine-binding chemotaxis protein CheW